MSLAQPEATTIASFQLPTQSSSSSPPFQSDLAQKEAPGPSSAKSLPQDSPATLPVFISFLSLLLFSLFSVIKREIANLVQKEQTETMSAIEPTQTVHAHKEQMVVQWPKPKEHANQCLPKPPDKVEFVLPDFSINLQLHRET